MTLAGLVRPRPGLGVLMLAAVLATVPLTARAEETGAGAKKSTAVGASSNWDAKVSSGDSVSGITLDQAQVAIIERVNRYFNDLDTLAGEFWQTDPEQKRSKGKFFLQRPGKFRFVYGAPSRLVILSDGETLSFEDKDVDSFDRYPIESTPFRVLLEPIVDLIKTATILDLYEGEELVVVTLQDRDDDSTGQMKIFFVVEGGELQLREWVITGPQGGDTRVELARVTRGEKLAADLFKLTPIIADLLNQRN